MPWKILVVDDDVDTCENLSDILTDFGHEVRIAHNGREALQRAEETPFDIVLLDLQMPGMDGLDLCRELKRSVPTTVAILITGFADSETERRAAQIGIWRLLPKPLKVELLMPLVQQAIEQPMLLLVDDDADFCSSLYDVLSQRDCRVAIAHSSTEAVKQFHAQNFRTVIVDWRLPDIDGLQLLQQIRAEQPNMQTVLITGHRPELNSLLEVTAMNQADELFYKPLDIEPFVTKLFQLMSC